MSEYFIYILSSSSSVCVVAFFSISVVRLLSSSFRELLPSYGVALFLQLDDLKRALHFSPWSIRNHRFFMTNVRDFAQQNETECMAPTVNWWLNLYTLYIVHLFLLVYFSISYCKHFFPQNVRLNNSLLFACVYTLSSINIS